MHAPRNQSGLGRTALLGGHRRPARRVREMVAASGRTILVGVDGGVTKANIAEVGALGPDVIVTGSAIFDGTSDVEANARSMRASSRHAP